MFTIYILDDERMDLEKERRITEDYFRRKGLECRVEAYQDARWLLGDIAAQKYDMYILDVEMPQLSGLEVAREIRKYYPDPVIIFVTNFVDYAVEAYEVNTYRYIPKEILQEKLTEAYEALLPQILEQEKKYYIIEKKADVEKINYEDLFYLKKDGRYTVLVHRHGESRVRKSMADVMHELDSPEFIVINKGYVANIRHIMNLKDHLILMRDGTKLPVGAPRLGQVKQEIVEYWRR